MPAHPLEREFVNIQNVEKLFRDRLQAAFQLRVAEHLFRLFDGGRFAFDVREDIENFRHVAAHVGFEFGDLIVSVFQRHALVEFNVLLDVEVAGKVLHADVMHVEVAARGHSANAVENVFRALGAGQRLHGDVSAGQNAVHGLGNGVDQLA